MDRSSYSHLTIPDVGHSSHNQTEEKKTCSSGIYLGAETIDRLGYSGNFPSLFDAENRRYTHVSVDDCVSLESDCPRGIRFHGPESAVVVGVTITCEGSWDSGCVRLVQRKGCDVVRFARTPDNMCPGNPQAQLRSR